MLKHELSLSSRRQFIQSMAAAGFCLTFPKYLRGSETNIIQNQPFENGVRYLRAFPQKKPLIVITTRPPHLETPFSVFNEGVFTPNDSFFVRYHLADLPFSVNLDSYRLKVTGKVERELNLTLAEIKTISEPVEVIAVNQCSGNSRGFSSPRVNGAQLGNGSMGNARYVGVPLKKVLEKAGIQAGVVQATFCGLDKPVLPESPRFIKALNIDHALSHDVLLAWSMNGEDLPFLNGYPLKLIVPGFFSTYWIKHLSEINLIDHEYDGFFMKEAYRVPETLHHSILPSTIPQKMIPINHLPVRSFFTNLNQRDKLTVGRDYLLKGIAFDGGTGIKYVFFSEDGGKTWKETFLQEDHGKYSFRQWIMPFTAKKKGEYKLVVRAVNRENKTQPLTAVWNPGGYAQCKAEEMKIFAV